jgi:hypothetical protein
MSRQTMATDFEVSTYIILPNRKDKKKKKKNGYLPVQRSFK